MKGEGTLSILLKIARLVPTNVHQLVQIAGNQRAEASLISHRKEAANEKETLVGVC